MKIGIIGLGKMGLNMANFITKKHSIVGYDPNKKTVLNAKIKKIIPAFTLEEFEKKLGKNKIIWLMVPHQFVTQVIKQLKPHLHKGDIVIDGGNSYYVDSLKHATMLKKQGVQFLDIGVSGGVVAAKQGYCLMVGGNKKSYEKVKPILNSMTGSKGGVEYMGESGTGHYVKMIHNGIEYGMLQAIGEGFAILHDNKKFTKLDMRTVSSIWRKGSVVSGFLMDLSNQVFSKDPHLKKWPSIIGSSGMGLWTVMEGKKQKIHTPVISSALKAREVKMKKNFSAKVISALRNAFGGHIPPKK